MIFARLLPRVRRVSSRTRLRNRARDCGAMRRRGCSPFVKPKPRNLRAGPEAKASRRSSRSCPSTSSGGAATSDSARPRRCCANLTNGPDEGCVPWSGCNGNEGLLVMPNCDAAASAGIRRRKPPVAHVVLGGSATVPHLPWLYRTPHSNRSVLQLLRYQASLIYRTAVYGPVCTVVWEGRSREAPPYPDQIFKRGRDFAAWLGLTPLQRSTGGKQKLGETSRMGERTLRRLLIIGASAAVRWAMRKGTTADPWLSRLLSRKPKMLAIVALANKTARIVWALMAKGG